MSINTGIRIWWLMLFLWPATGWSQYVIEALPRWMVSGHANAMFAQPPASTFMDSDDWGFQFEAQYRVQYNRPFLAGIYYSEAILSAYAIEYIMYDPDGEVEVKNKAKTNRLETGLTFGFYPEINWLLQPYLQGRMGVAWFKTNVKISDNETGEILDRMNIMTESVLSYGLDLGIHIVPKIWYVRGDLRVGFVANPSVTYMTLNEDDMDTVGYPIDFFETHTTSCKWIKVSAGVSYLF